MPVIHKRNRVRVNFVDSHPLPNLLSPEECGKDKRMKTKSLSALIIVACCISAQAQQKVSVKTVNNLPYYDKSVTGAADSYQASQCMLDLRYPENTTGFATVVWFHGGGLTSGKRHFIDLLDKTIAVAAVSYRLSPKVEHPGYLQDAAAATAWVIRNIAQYGGDSNKVFVAGHSAGGYLSAMIGMDPRWMAERGIDHNSLAGIMPVSGQMTTHFHVKKQRGDTGPEFRPIIDEFAPLYHSASNLPPICLILGDRRIEYKNRVEENALLDVSLRNLGHPHVEFYEMGGLNHGTVGRGGLIPLENFVKTLRKNSKR